MPCSRNLGKFPVADGEEHAAARRQLPIRVQDRAFGQRSFGQCAAFLRAAHEPEQRAPAPVQRARQLETHPTCTEDEPRFHDLFIIG